ncbi:MAG: right-handed parallel beta-helix repeat-containing protein [Candidatus Bathyarchaeaceae archaeon]
MRNKTAATVFASALLLSAILGAELTMPVDASIHHVYPGESIQEAINSAQPGDTVFVHEGTYPEQVSVNKSLALIGENANTTIIKGVDSRNTSNVKICGFTIRQRIHGIALNGCNTIIVSGNIVTGNTQYGIFLVNSRNITISGNIVLNNGVRGIYLRYSNNNTVTNNTVSKHSQYGILLYSSSYNVVGDNTVSNSTDRGIWLNNGSYNIFSGNVISNNTHGIDLLYARHNTLRNNIVINNGVGFWLFSSTNNEIYHNNLINNTNQAHDYSASSNYWYHPTLLEGNYWSDYAGADDGSGVGKHAIAGDGIGDTLIPHPETNYDFYPLIEPWTPSTLVGGIWLPVNKLSLLAPYIGLTTLLATAVITLGYVEKRKRKRD